MLIFFSVVVDDVDNFEQGRDVEAKNKKEKDWKNALKGSTQQYKIVKYLVISTPTNNLQEPKFNVRRNPSISNY